MIRKASGVASVSVVLIASLVLLVALAGAAVQQRAVSMPHIDVGLGGVRLIVYETRIPSCSPEGPCAQAFALAQHARRDYVVVWMLYPKSVGKTRLTAGRRLLTVPLAQQVVPAERSR